MNTQSLLSWVIAYIIDSIFWYWIAFGKGARWLTDRLWTIFLIGPILNKAGPDGLQFYAMIILLLSTIWFLLGLFIPDFRFAFPGFSHFVGACPHVP